MRLRLAMAAALSRPAPYRYCLLKICRVNPSWTLITQLTSAIVYDNFIAFHAAASKRHHAIIKPHRGLDPFPRKCRRRPANVEFLDPALIVLAHLLDDLPTGDRRSARTMQDWPRETRLAGNPWIHVNQVPIASQPVKQRLLAACFRNSKKIRLPVRDRVRPRNPVVRSDAPISKGNDPGLPTHHWLPTWQANDTVQFEYTPFTLPPVVYLGHARIVEYVCGRRKRPVELEHLLAGIHRPNSQYGRFSPSLARKTGACRRTAATIGGCRMPAPAAAEGSA